MKIKIGKVKMTKAFAFSPFNHELQLSNLVSLVGIIKKLYR